jgi:hypothetical protein
MKKTEIIQKLYEAVQSTKASISALDNWLELLADKEKCTLDPVKQMAEEMSALPEFDGDEKVLEGVFDGQNMIAGADKKYPVPANYASKSKLVVGDRLKLTIQQNGAFVYKQTELVARRLATGYLILDGSQYKVLAENLEYKVLYASITFFRAKVGDEMTIILPEDGSSEWAAIENILPSIAMKESV